ncbi:hypothetical protein H6A12_03675 [Phocea massiliensis]|uniref:Uncharacterized protein n=1 Tax=Merdimmobilis hominis TaxID=2897707 RepID=A0A938X5C3_9FIRM|nr:hypothetical protein [Merdimmobilis hominis]MBM6920258.1 hypothetical protein [Merdimmobilis hominis]
MKKRTGIMTIVLTISILLTGCGGKTVEQKNDSLSCYFLSNANEKWYEAAKERVFEAYPDIKIDLKWWTASQYLMFFSREHQDTDITPLQEYYDKITSDLRKDQAGDIVMGDATYLEWPEAAPPDWYKLMKSGAFADLNPLAEENGQLDTTTYMKVNTDSAAASEERWTFVPILEEKLFFCTTEELAQQWDFSIVDDGNMSIVDFLEQCADWVEKHGDNPNAPSIMPDFWFQQLKSVAFDVCGLTITDYETGKVDFDNPTVKRILEALRTISTDIEDSGLGDQGTDEFEQRACEEKRYLLYKWLPSDVGTRKFISLLNIDETYFCMYASRWVAIPASSKNQTIAYTYIQELLNEKAVNGGNSDNLIDTYRETPPEFQDPNYKSYNIVIPSTWQYALSDLFDNYYAGHMETDEFMNQVQKRLEVYITE